MSDTVQSCRLCCCPVRRQNDSRTWARRCRRTCIARFDSASRVHKTPNTTQATLTHGEQQWRNTHWTRLDKCQGPPGLGAQAWPLYPFLCIYSNWNYSNLLDRQFYVTPLTNSSMIIHWKWNYSIRLINSFRMISVLWAGLNQCRLWLLYYHCCCYYYFYSRRRQSGEKRRLTAAASLWFCLSVCPQSR